MLTISYHFVEMFLNHVPVLVVAESFLDVEAHQVEGDALVQPSIGPPFRGDETAIKLLRPIKSFLIRTCTFRVTFIVFVIVLMFYTRMNNFFANCAFIGVLFK